MKKMLFTSGFPRSGNTYLNQALQLLYYPEEEVNQNNFTVKTIKENDKIIVPFRNPLDAIPSWYLYPRPSTMEDDIKFYIRFHESILDNLSKIVLMDFNFFTKDINYIKNTVLENYDIDTQILVTDFQVKETMLANNKELYLPRNNAIEIDAIRTKLQEMPEFVECIDLYKRLHAK
jgi:hypothetical protein